MGWWRRLQCPEEAHLPVGTGGSAFVPLLVGDEVEHGGAVEDGLWERDAQEEAHLHRTQADWLGRQQGRVVRRAQERQGGVLARSLPQLVQGVVRLAGPPLAG